MKSLVIVESPTKARTIRKYLPGNGSTNSGGESRVFVVDSSMGHIRDLPASAKEIPSKFKKEDWANLGVNVDHDFEPLYVIPHGKKKVVKKLKKELKESDELILATDEDREGEAISWHLTKVLNPDVPVKRMVFHEITEEAIQQALEEFRDIDMNLVNAQETRRILDRLAGYTISPLLWKKVAPGLSAGRVQSVAVEFLVQRERERMRFKKGRYWDLSAHLNKEGQKKQFQADLAYLDGKRLASGKDFDENTGKLKKPDAVELLDDKKAKALQKALDKKAEWSVKKVNTNRKKRSPAPPFITSTLQQEANRKFGMSAKQTMQIAQRLYENGYITYMRTDSYNLSNQAIHAAREAVEDKYGDDYLYKSVRTYRSKSKMAQEAHEAIRPAGGSFTTPKKAGLSGGEFKIYDLIWKRTIATQMSNAQLEFRNVDIEAKTKDHTALFKASGKKILFPGFFRAYVEGSDDPNEALGNQERWLPKLSEEEQLECNEITANDHETKPPSRFTEATLVKELENKGVGRPSTYANIISTIQDRGYTDKQGKTLVPTYTAFAVTELLENHFPELVDSDFTSELEHRLDEIARGNEDPKQYLKSFYKGDSGLEKKVEQQEDKIDPREAKRLNLPLEGLEGDELQVFVGRYGPYIQQKENGESVRTSLPNDLSPGDITIEKLKELIQVAKEGPEPLGQDPETGENVYVLTGRYGPYVQRGESDGDEKPKRVSLLKGMSPKDVDLDLALQLLSLPRTLGEHPETGKEVKAGIGRYGPYVLHDGTFKSLPKKDNVLEVELDRAVELLKRKKKNSKEIQNLGNHPENGRSIRVLDGRYGPYIKYGNKNISLSDDVDPEEITLEEATEIIDEKTNKK